MKEIILTEQQQPGRAPGRDNPTDVEGTAGTDFVTVGSTNSITQLPMGSSPNLSFYKVTCMIEKFLEGEFSSSYNTEVCLCISGL